jgi:hypothetical protein
VTEIQRASPTIIFHGQRIERRSGFVVGSHLICPGGHRFRPNLGADALVFMCTQRTAPGRICGAPMYLLYVPARGVTQPAMIWFADVDVNDVEIIRDMSIDQILTYFGVSSSGMERAG